MRSVISSYTIPLAARTPPTDSREVRNGYVANNDWMPRIVQVKLARDHLERLANARSPLDAVSELIWNAFDADATEVNVVLLRNHFGDIDGVEVSDNGHGMRHEDALEAFERLGASPKRLLGRSRGGRILHGRQGKGRFQAFALGSEVRWLSRYRENGFLREYTIQGNRATLDQFAIEDPQISSAASTGTVATVTTVGRSLSFLESDRARHNLAEEFALYMRQYTGIILVFDGERIDPSTVEEWVTEYQLDAVLLDNGRHISPTLTIVEWTTTVDRLLFLCDENGFSLERTSPGIHAPGFMFTAYLKSEIIRELFDRGELTLDELSGDLRTLVDSAKDQLRSHFRKRASEQAGKVVDEWKKEKVYPYEGNPRSVIEEVERQVFDVVALNVHEYLPDFAESSRENRKLSFQLLKTAIETSPEAIQLLLADVLAMPQEKREELVQLLERTSLDSIISAAKIVADRLDFLQGLELLVFDPLVKHGTLERRHLHKIVAEHTWLFGEEFNLTVSDRGLTAVLQRHRASRDFEILDDSPVTLDDGTAGIVDLMLSRLVPQARADQREHLIVELKRPTVQIGSSEAAQIKDYATAIVKDERFRDTETRWEFWVVSNQVEEAVSLEANQKGRPAGLLWDLEIYRLRIWVKTWGQIIEACRGRLRFFQERLNYVADEDSGLAYLRRVHEKYLPKGLTDEDQPATDK